MSIYKGNSEIKNLYYGSQKIKEVWKGSQLIYREATWKQHLFTTVGSGTFLIPEDAIQLRINMVSGGGGAGNSTFYHGNKWAGRSGGSGAWVDRIFSEEETKSFRGKTLNYTIGAAGQAAAGPSAGGPISSGGQRGTDGGESNASITDLFTLTCTGGTGGMSGWYNFDSNVAGGVATGGNTKNVNGNSASVGDVFAKTPTVYTYGGDWGSGGWQNGYGGSFGDANQGFVEIFILSPG